MYVCVCAYTVHKTENQINRNQQNNERTKKKTSNENKTISHHSGYGCKRCVRLFFLENVVCSERLKELCLFLEARVTHNGTSEHEIADDSTQQIGE